MGTMDDGGPVTGIQDVLARLAAVRADAIRRRSRVGYFAAVYVRITERVQAAIESRTFSDGKWIERLDVAFATRYLDALHQYQSAAPGAAPNSWDFAFRAATRRTPIILQHILLGINAHVNFDLGIATAGVVANFDELQTRQADFNKINQCAADEVRDLSSRLGAASPIIGAFGFFNGGAANDRYANFGIDESREQAWLAAELLTSLPHGQVAEQERVLDRNATAVARLILNPPGAIPELALRLVRATELHSVRSVIKRL